MVEVLIGLGVIGAFFWLIAGPAYLVIEFTDFFDWKLHVVLLPWYFIIVIVAYKIGEAIRG